MKRRCASRFLSTAAAPPTSCRRGRSRPSLRASIERRAALHAGPLRRRRRPDLVPHRRLRPGRAVLRRAGQRQRRLGLRLHRGLACRRSPRCRRRLLSLRNGRPDPPALGAHRRAHLDPHARRRANASCGSHSRRASTARGLRSVWKNLSGTRLRFREEHPSGRLSFEHEWSSAAGLGLVRTASLRAQRQARSRWRCSTACSTWCRRASALHTRPR